MNKIIFPEDLLLEIQDIQSRLNVAYANLGAVTSALEKINSEIEVYEEEQRKVLEKCFTVEEEQRILKDRIVSTYGEGNLDLNTGEYIKS
jgi:uncharacterized protein (DUF3084 family)